MKMTSQLYSCVTHILLIWRNETLHEQTTHADTHTVEITEGCSPARLNYSSPITIQTQHNDRKPFPLTDTTTTSETAGGRFTPEDNRISKHNRFALKHVIILLQSICKTMKFFISFLALVTPPNWNIFSIETMIWLQYWLTISSIAHLANQPQFVTFCLWVVYSISILLKYFFCLHSNMQFNIA